MAGVFIVFEGSEGSGKSTQAAALAARLESAGYECLLTREPGGTSIGERIRGVLLSQKSAAMTPATEALLHTAARAQHVDEVIRPALVAGKVVICDRFIDSTYAYQGGGRGLDQKQLSVIQCLAVGETVPNVRFLLDLPVELGLARRRAEPSQLNRMDDASRAFHQRVRQTYLARASGAPEEWVVLDATLPIQHLVSLIDMALRERVGINVMTASEPVGVATAVTVRNGRQT